MPSKFQEVLAGAALGMAQATVGALFTDLLENIKENNTNDPALITDTVQGMHKALLLLDRAADKTKSTLDNKALDMLWEPIKAFAAQNDIPLE